MTRQEIIYCPEIGNMSVYSQYDDHFVIVSIQTEYKINYYKGDKWIKTDDMTQEEMSKWLKSLKDNNPDNSSIIDEYTRCVNSSIDL